MTRPVPPHVYQEIVRRVLRGESVPEIMRATGVGKSRTYEIRGEVLSGLQRGVPDAHLGRETTAPPPKAAHPEGDEQGLARPGSSRLPAKPAAPGSLPAPQPPVTPPSAASEPHAPPPPLPIREVSRPGRVRQLLRDRTVEWSWVLREIVPIGWRLAAPDPPIIELDPDVEEWCTRYAEDGRDPQRAISDRYELLVCACDQDLEIIDVFTTAEWYAATRTYSLSPGLRRL